jgi:hypothetical protein
MCRRVQDLLQNSNAKISYYNVFQQHNLKKKSLFFLARNSGLGFSAAVQIYLLFNYTGYFLIMRKVR